MAKRRNPSKKLVRARRNLRESLSEAGHNDLDAMAIAAAIEDLAYILIRDMVRDALEEIEHEA